MKPLLDFINSICIKSGYVMSRYDLVRGEVLGDYHEVIWEEKLQPIFKVAIKDMRDFMGHDYLKGGNNPLIKTLQEYINSKGVISYGESPLKKYYDSFQPRTTLEVFFPQKSGDNVSINEGLTEYLLPWDQKPKIKPGGERLMYSGPMSEDRGKYEMSRTIEVFKSIKSKGYKPLKSASLFRTNYIQGYFLKRDDDFRFIVLHGKHRAAALAVLNYDYAFATFQLGKPRLVDYDQVNQWPQVKNGTYSVKCSLAIFNKFFC